MVFYPSKWTCESVLELISEKTTKDCSRIWVLNGRYPNLKIIISQEDSSYGNEMYQALKQQAEEIGFSATVIVGHNCKELHCLRRGYKMPEVSKKKCTVWNQSEVSDGGR